MSIKEDIAYLKEAVLEAQRELSRRTDALVHMQSDIQNHVYESLEHAENVLSDMLWEQANEDCVGAHNCGNEEYSQDFIVADKEYTATEKFEYNRHDKTYYYIDGHTYSYKEKK